MSLINDALKQARQAQQKHPPTPIPGLALRPAETPEPASFKTSVLPLLIGLLLFAVVFVLWRNLAARPEAQKQANALLPSEVLVVQAKPLEAPPAAEPPAVAAVSEVPATNHVEVLPDIVVPVPATNAPPEPAPLRLQAIVFNPSRPSALISGKTVFIGDRLDDLRVTTITRDTAVLVGGGQTNVLTLPE